MALELNKIYDQGVNNVDNVDPPPNLEAGDGPNLREQLRDVAASSSLRESRFGQTESNYTVPDIASFREQLGVNDADYTRFSHDELFQKRFDNMGVMDAYIKPALNMAFSPIAGFTDGAVTTVELIASILNGANSNVGMMDLYTEHERQRADGERFSFADTIKARGRDWIPESGRGFLGVFDSNRSITGYFDTMGSLFESVGEFATIGSAISKSVQKVTTTGFKLLNKMASRDISKMAITVGKNSVKLPKAANVVAHSMLMGGANGMMQGADVYQQSYEHKLNSLLEQRRLGLINLTDEEINKQVLDFASANRSTTFNYTFGTSAFLNAIGGAHYFFRPSSNKLLNSLKTTFNDKTLKSAKDWVDHINKTMPTLRGTMGQRAGKYALEGGSEAIEEVMENFAVEMGLSSIKSGHTPDLLNDINKVAKIFKDSALSLEGLESAIGGFVGGTSQNFVVKRLPLNKVPRIPKQDADGNYVDAKGNKVLKASEAEMIVDPAYRESLNSTGKNILDRGYIKLGLGSHIALENHQNITLFNDVREKILDDFSKIEDIENKLHSAMRTGNVEALEKLRESMFTSSILSSVQAGHGEAVRKYFEGIAMLEPSTPEVDTLMDEVKQLNDEIKSYRHQGLDTTTLEENRENAYTELKGLVKDLNPVFMGLADNSQDVAYKERAKEVITDIDAISKMQEESDKIFGVDEDAPDEYLQALSNVLTGRKVAKYMNEKYLKKNKEALEELENEILGDYESTMEGLDTTRKQVSDAIALSERMQEIEDDREAIKRLNKGNLDEDAVDALLSKYGMSPTVSKVPLNKKRGLLLDLHNMLVVNHEDLHKEYGNIVSSLENSEAFTKYKEQGGEDNLVKWLEEIVPQNVRRKNLNDNIKDLENENLGLSKFIDSVKGTDTIEEQIATVKGYLESLEEEKLEMLRNSHSDRLTAIKETERYAADKELEVENLIKEFEQSKIDISKENEELRRESAIINFSLSNLAKVEANMKTIRDYNERLSKIYAEENYNLRKIENLERQVKVLKSTLVKIQKLRGTVKVDPDPSSEGAKTIAPPPAGPITTIATTGTEESTETPSSTDIFDDSNIEIDDDSIIQQEEIDREIEESKKAITSLKADETSESLVNTGIDTEVNTGTTSEELVVVENAIDEAKAEVIINQGSDIVEVIPENYDQVLDEVNDNVKILLWDLMPSETFEENVYAEIGKIVAGEDGALEKLSNTLKKSTDSAIENSESEVEAERIADGFVQAIASLEKLDALSKEKKQNEESLRATGELITEALVPEEQVGTEEDQVTGDESPDLKEPNENEITDEESDSEIDYSNIPIEESPTDNRITEGLDFVDNRETINSLNEEFGILFENPQGKYVRIHAASTMANKQVQGTNSPEGGVSYIESKTKLGSRVYVKDMATPVANSPNGIIPGTPLMFEVDTEFEGNVLNNSDDFEGPNKKFQSFGDFLDENGKIRMEGENSFEDIPIKIKLVDGTHVGWIRTGSWIKRTSDGSSVNIQATLFDRDGNVIDNRATEIEEILRIRRMFAENFNNTGSTQLQGNATEVTNGKVNYSSPSALISQADFREGEDRVVFISTDGKVMNASKEDLANLNFKEMAEKSKTNLVLTVNTPTGGRAFIPLIPKRIDNIYNSENSSSQTKISTTINALMKMFIAGNTDPDINKSYYSMVDALGEGVSTFKMIRTKEGFRNSMNQMGMKIVSYSDITDEIDSGKYRTYKGAVLTLKANGENSYSPVVVEFDGKGNYTTTTITLKGKDFDTRSKNALNRLYRNSYFSPAKPNAVVKGLGSEGEVVIPRFTGKSWKVNKYENYNSFIGNKILIPAEKLQFNGSSEIPKYRNGSEVSDETTSTFFVHPIVSFNITPPVIQTTVNNNVEVNKGKGLIDDDAFEDFRPTVGRGFSITMDTLHNLSNKVPPSRHNGRSVGEVWDSYVAIGLDKAVIPEGTNPFEKC